LKLLRFLLFAAIAAVAIAALACGLLLVPAVQTLLAGSALSGPGVDVKLGSLSAGFGRVDVSDLAVTTDGGVLKVPSLRADLPIVSALWNRSARVSRLEAKGWTLDLAAPQIPKGNTPAQDEGSPGGSHARQADALRGAAQALAGLLGKTALPFAVALDGVELEGDILIQVPGQRAPTQVHVILTGGGLAEGREGTLTLDAAAVLADSEIAANAVEAHGRLVLLMGPERRLERAKLEVEVADTGGRIPKGQVLSVAIARGQGTGDEDITLGVGRAGRSVADIVAHFRGATQGFDGSWRLDVGDADLAFLTRTTTLPVTSASGDGRFDASGSLERIHVLGRIRAVVRHLGILAEPLEAMGTVGAEASFDAVHAARSLHVDELTVALGGSPPAALFKSGQPFDIDEESGRVTPTDPTKELLDLTVRDLPVAWLSGLTGPFRLTEGRATGVFSVRPSGQGIALVSKSALVAKAVTISRAGAVIGSNLDLTLNLNADKSAGAWNVQLAPLGFASQGRSLATLNAKVSRASGAGQPVVIAGTWDADLDALPARSGKSGPTRMTARLASGDFSAVVADTTKVDGKVLLVGHDAGHKVEADLHAEVFADGTIEFKLPAKLEVGPAPSDVSLDGTWTPGEDGGLVGVELSGGQVSLEHLKFMASQLGLLGGGQVSLDAVAPPGLAPGAPGLRDTAPFWGSRRGSVMIVFDRLTSANDVFKDVRGTIEFEQGSLLLKRGRCSLAHHTLENVDGKLSFDAAADRPYSLKVAGSEYQVDAAEVFNPPPKGQDPAVEGHFTVASSLEGDGANLGDLISRTQVRYLLKSTGGIFRALKTDVADTIPEASTPVADTLGTVGSAVGSLFGLKPDVGARNPVSKTAEAVMQFTNNVAEIGYDLASLTATERSDRTIGLSEISMTAPDERLTGKGQIGYAKGLALRDQAISLDLQVWVRGKLAELLATAGLLSAQKDAAGYCLLGESVHLGGTLGNIDVTRWHDLLAKAANRKPPVAKAAK